MTDASPFYAESSISAVAAANREVRELRASLRAEDVQAKRATVALGDLRADLEDMDHHEGDERVREILRELIGRVTEIHDGLN